METVQRPVDDLMSIHDRRKASIEKVIKDNEGTDNYGLVIGLSEDITALLDDADSVYALARRV